MRKIHRYAIATLAFGLVAAACGSDDDSSDAAVETAAPVESASSEPDEPTGGYNIWYVNPLPSFEAWGDSNDTFEAAAADLGYVPTIVGPDEIDILAMVSMIEQAIADGADGIITCSLDPDSFADVIARAQAAGIVVVSIGCVDDNADFSVGTDNEEYGRVSADLIAEAVGAGAEVAIMGTSRATPNQIAQVDGFRAQNDAEAYGLDEVVWEENQSDPAIAAEKIGALLTAYPDLDVLWLVEGAAPGVVPAAFAEAGKDPGDVFVLSIDALEPTLVAIEDGWIGTTLNQCYFDASPFAAELIIASLEGRAPEQTFFSIPVDPVTADSLPYEGCPADVVPSL